MSRSKRPFKHEYNYDNERRMIPATTVSAAVILCCPIPLRSRHVYKPASSRCVSLIYRDPLCRIYMTALAYTESPKQIQRWRMCCQPNCFFAILNQLLTEPLHWRILSRSIHKGSIYSFIRRLFTLQAERDQWNNTISYAQQNWRQTNIFKNIAKFITIWDLKESLKSR